MAEEGAATETTEAAVNESQDAQQPTVEELQRRLEQAEQRAKSAEGRYKAIQRTSLITGEALAEMEDRMAQTYQRALKEAFETDDPAERARRLGEVEAERKQQAALAKRITDAQPRLDRIVEDSGKDFSDPAFAEASAAWDAGRPEEAIALARIAVSEARSGNTYTKEEVDQMLEAARKNGRAEESRVDTGRATASSGSERVPTTAAELAQYLRSRRTEGNPVSASEHAALIRGLQG